VERVIAYLFFLRCAIDMGLIPNSLVH